jgi:hypothetical protein
MPAAMEPRTLDRKTADLILIGALHPDDAPPGYQRVARFTQTVRHQQACDPPAGPTHLLDLLVTIRASDKRHRGGGPRHRIGQVMGAGAITIVAVASSLATVGALPAPLQEATRSVYRAVAVALPHTAHRHQPPGPATGRFRSGHMNASPTVPPKPAIRLRASWSSAVPHSRTADEVRTAAGGQKVSVGHLTTTPSTTADPSAPTTTPVAEPTPNPVVTPPVPPVSHGPPIPPGPKHHPRRHHRRHQRNPSTGSYSSAIGARER